MSPTAIRPIVVVGGGIVGMAVALALVRSRATVVVLEAETEPARHQTGHNSGVLHSGLYYAPGSLKASLCVEGRRELERFCRDRGLPYRRCGKLVVARTAAEEPALDELERRGRANGLEGLERLDLTGLRRREPHASGVAGLWVPETGVVDFSAVTRALASEIRQAGGEIRCSSRVRGIVPQPGGVAIETDSGTLEATHLVNCAGLQSDRLARLAGIDPGARIIPFRGRYLGVRPERQALVRGLIYPVPDPRFPFLGVHLTRRVDGTVEAGPNAVLGLAREGYGRLAFSSRDTADIVSWSGFWKLAALHWRTGLGEMRRSVDRRAFVRGIQSLVPELKPGDLSPAGCGIRAQAVDAAGRLLDDFHVVGDRRSTHVINAPSPAATACLAIGRQVARRALEVVG